MKYATGEEDEEDNDSNPNDDEHGARAAADGSISAWSLSLNETTAESAELRWAVI